VSGRQTYMGRHLLHGDGCVQPGLSPQVNVAQLSRGQFAAARRFRMTVAVALPQRQGERAHKRCRQSPVFVFRYIDAVEERDEKSAQHLVGETAFRSDLILRTEHGVEVVTVYDGDSPTPAAAAADRYGLALGHDEEAPLRQACWVPLGFVSELEIERVTGRVEADEVTVVDDVVDDEIRIAAEFQMNATPLAAFRLCVDRRVAQRGYRCKIGAVTGADAAAQTGLHVH